MRSVTLAQGAEGVSSIGSDYGPSQVLAVGRETSAVRDKCRKRNAVDNGK
jgi:hypothetical protein